MKRGIPALVLAVVLVPVKGDATTVVRLEHPELVERARHVVWGDCVSKRAVWNDARSQIFTEVTLTPRETLKGERRATVTLKLPGGERDGRSYVVHGMPRFRVGQEVVVYATPPHEETEVCVPVGLGQGVYYVRRAGRESPRALRDMRELTLVGAEGRGADEGDLESVALDDLLGRIRREVAAQEDDG